MLLVLHQGARPQKKMGVAGKILKWDTHGGRVKVGETQFFQQKKDEESRKSKKGEKS